MLWRKACVIYHALQSLRIDWNKINVVRGPTASIYRVVSAAVLQGSGMVYNGCVEGLFKAGGLQGVDTAARGAEMRRASETETFG